MIKLRKALNYKDWLKPHFLAKSKSRVWLSCSLLKTESIQLVFRKFFQVVHDKETSRIFQKPNGLKLLGIKEEYIWKRTDGVATGIWNWLELNRYNANVSWARSRQIELHNFQGGPFPLYIYIFFLNLNLFILIGG